MAIVTELQQGAEPTLYNIPDAELQKYKVKTAELTDEKKAQLFPNKATPTKEDAQGVMPGAVMAQGDVQAYSLCVCWVTDGDVVIWWYCDC